LDAGIFPYLQNYGYTSSQNTSCNSFRGYQAFPKGKGGAFQFEEPFLIRRALVAKECCK
jgi:hypothetical protein